MTRSRTLAAAVISAAVTLSALALPAAGADNPLLTLVNGIPGKKVDVCVGSKEVRSNLAYGAYVQKRQAAGKKTIRFRKASAGTCKGQVLAQTTTQLPAGGDKTVVATAKAPKRVLVFDNASATHRPGPTPTPDGWFLPRHAADLGAVTFKITFWDLYVPEQPIFGPAADPVYTKGVGYQIGSHIALDLVIRIRVTRPDQNVTLAKSLIQPSIGQRREYILVGSKAKNAKIVSIATDLLPAP